MPKNAGPGPDNVQKLYDEFETKRSPVEWAFRWLGNCPEIMTILSGCNEEEQISDNLRIFDTIEAGVMDEKELKKQIIRHFLALMCDWRSNLPRIGIRRIIDGEIAGETSITAADVPVPDSEDTVLVRYSKMDETRRQVVDVDENTNEVNPMLAERQDCLGETGHVNV